MGIFIIQHKQVSLARCRVYRVLANVSAHQAYLVRAFKFLTAIFFKFSCDCPFLSSILSSALIVFSCVLCVHLLHVSYR